MRTGSSGEQASIVSRKRTIEMRASAFI
jgi:hypothetical protein